MTKNIVKRIFTSLILITLLFIGLYNNDFTWNVLVTIFLIICFYEFYNLINKINLNKFFSILLTFLIGFYLYIFYLILISIKAQLGEEVILILLITCIFSDIGGYIFGKLFGGPKLTSISPNKTISGSIGSILLTIIGTILFILLLASIEKKPINLELTLEFNFWLIIMSIYCQIGDLLISYLKRKAKVKDTGNILPGHGGILDRLDGMLFAIPFGVLTYFILT
ncbi:phosphatidate cytidylyltransferase [Candidatus Pelagibacter sp. HIMB1509]|uniref:phosphatidate cytidylyltransferase n=1 Tax=Candidatus Pelagibacter sp. HIMB1509 TaxID=3413339 RepID=UPI003F878C18